MCPGKLDYLNQTNTYLSYNFNNQIRIRKKIQNIDLQYNISLEKNTENIINTSEYTFNRPFIGAEKLDFTSFTHSLRSMYDKRSFRLILGAIYAYSNIKSDWENAENKFFRPHLLIMYRLSPKWNVSSSYSAKIYQPSIIQVNHLHTLYDQLSTAEGGAELANVGMMDTYNFSIFRSFEIGEEATFFNTSFSYNPKSTEIHPVYSFDSFFQIKSYQLLNKENQMQFQLFYNKKFSFWNYNINILGSKSKLNLEENIIQDQTFATTFIINYLKLKNIRMSSGMDIRISARENTFSRSLNIYLRPSISVGFDKGVLQGRIWYQLFYNQVNDSKNVYHILNCELAKKRIIKNFELNVKIYDMFHIIPANINTTIFNPIYIQTNAYRTFSGQILMGLKWYFK